jgi:predicted nucleotidyltransferase
MSRAKFLNKKQVIGEIARLAHKIRLQNNNIRKIVLFGSLVNDTYTALSDADLLVVLKESDQRIVDRIPEMLLAFIDSPVPVDVFPYLEDELARVPLAQRALKNGLVLTEE